MSNLNLATLFAKIERRRTSLQDFTPAEIRKGNRIHKNSIFENGTNIIFLRLHKNAYCFDYEGERWIFINSKFKAKKRTKFIEWGKEFIGEMGGVL